MAEVHAPAPRTDAGVDVGALTRNAAWLAAGELSSRLIAFGVAIYLARVLGAGGFGQIGAALAAVSYVLIVVDAGLDPYGTREVARDAGRLPAVLTQVVMVRFLLAVAMFGLLTVLAYALPETALGRRDLAIVYGGSLLAHASSGAWALRGRDRMADVALGVVVQHVLYAAAVLLLVRAPDPLLVLVPAAHVAGELARNLLYYRALRRLTPVLRTPTYRAERRVMVRESAPFAVAKGLRLFYYQGDLLLLTWLAGAEPAGQFLASHKIVLALAMLAMLYQQNAYPTLSRLSLADPARAASFQDAVSRGALLLSVPVVVGVAMVSPALVALMYGPEYAPSGPILTVMIFTGPLLVISIGLENRLLALGRSGAVLRASALGTAGHVLLGVLWIPQFGALGAARASLVGRACVLTLVAIALAGRGTLFSRRSLAVLAAGAVMAATMALTGGLQILPRVILGGMAYAGATFALGAVRPAELRAVASFRVGRVATSDTDV